jgi:hypothetical protein
LDLCGERIPSVASNTFAILNDDVVKRQLDIVPVEGDTGNISKVKKKLSGEVADIKLESVGNVGGRFYLIGPHFNCRPNGIGIDFISLVEYLWL